ncbi:MAG: hypothetical protein WCO31_06675, partial [Actinomycetes bacterium]
KALCIAGAGGGGRTHDLLSTKQPLYLGSSSGQETPLGDSSQTTTLRIRQGLKSKQTHYAYFVAINASGTSVTSDEDTVTSK